MNYIFKRYSFSEACIEFLTYLNFNCKSDDIYVYVISKGNNLECIGGTSRIDNLEDLEIKSYLKENQNEYGAVSDRGCKTIVRDNCCVVPLIFDKSIYGYLYVKNSSIFNLTCEILDYISMVFYFFAKDKFKSVFGNAIEISLKKRIETIQEGCIAVIKLDNISGTNRSSKLEDYFNVIKKVSDDIIVNYDLIIMFIKEDKVTAGCKLRKLLDDFRNIVDIKIVYSTVVKNCLERCYAKIYDMKQNEIIYADDDFIVTERKDDTHVTNILTEEESADPFEIGISESGGFANYFKSTEKEGA